MQYKFQKRIQNLVKHLIWIFLQKSLTAPKANSKPCKTSEIEPFWNLLPATEMDSESFQTSLMELLCFYTLINLKNVMKVFVYFGISMAKKGVFIDTSYSVFFNPSISYQMSFTVISVDNSGLAGRRQRGRLASNNHR